MKKFLAILLAMLILLSFAACSFMKVKHPVMEVTQPLETQPQRVIGNKVGNLCQSFQVELADENGSTGEFTDPTATGKITVINFWGTWCSPCKSELPEFDQFARDYDVKVYAIHSIDGKEKMPAYIQENFPDSPIIFAYDEKVEGQILDKYFTLLGGSTGYPYTVVLDENGVIIHTQTGTMSYENLQQLYESA